MIHSTVHVLIIGNTSYLAIVQFTGYLFIYVGDKSFQCQWRVYYKQKVMNDITISHGLLCNGGYSL